MAETEKKDLTNADLLSKIDYLESQLSKANEEAEEKDALKTRINELENELDNVQQYIREKESLENKIVGLEDDLNKAELEIQQIESLKAKISELEGDLKHSKEERQNYKNKIIEAENNLQKSLSKNEELQKVNELLKIKIGELENSLKTKANELENSLKTNSNKDSLMLKIVELENIIKAKDSEYELEKDNLRNKICGLVDDLNKAELEIEEKEQLKSKINDLETVSKQKKIESERQKESENNSAQNKINELQQQIAELTTQNQQYVKEKDDMNNYVMTLLKQLEEKKFSEDEKLQKEEQSRKLKDGSILDIDSNDLKYCQTEPDDLVLKSVNNNFNNDNEDVDKKYNILSENVLSLLKDIKCDNRNRPFITNICFVLGISPLSMSKILANKKSKNLDKFFRKNYV